MSAPACVARLKAKQLDGYRSRVGQVFENEARLERLHAMRNELEGQLSGETDHSVVSALVGEFNGMKDVVVPVHVPEPVVHHHPVQENIKAVVAALGEVLPRQAEILPFEPLTIEGKAEIIPPRRMMPRQPAQQGNLFDAPRAVSEKAAEPVSSWARKVEKERGKPKQLGFGF